MIVCLLSLLVYPLLPLMTFPDHAQWLQEVLYLADNPEAISSLDPFSADGVFVVGTTALFSRI